MLEITFQLPLAQGIADYPIALVGVLSSLVGLYIAYYADVAASAAIVLTATGFFALAFLFAPGRGLLWQRRFAPAEQA